jgi:DNA-binding LytR/AlgR family response regulator
VHFVVLTNPTEVALVRTKDLLRLEADGNYCRVYWIGSSMLIRRPLHDCEKRLDRSKFFRVSRFCLVNLEQVEQVRQTRAQGLIRYVFILKGGTELMLSRKQSLALRRSRSL